jgi:hypothetical protein
MTASTMLTYVIGAVPSTTLAYLGTPTNDDAGPLKYVLADALTNYGVTTEAQVTDLKRFNLIGRALFWEWAVEYIVAADFAPAQQGAGADYSAHVAECRRLRDYYFDLANTYNGAPIQLADTVFLNDPYKFPRDSDKF